MLKSLDRLGRNYIEIQEEWRVITKMIEANIVVLDMPILDTRENKDLMGTFITDIVLQLLSYIAQVERENIRQRQAEGIAAAKLMGKHLGRPRKPYPEGFAETYEKYITRKVTAKVLVQELGVTVPAFRAHVLKKNEENKKMENINNEKQLLFRPTQITPLICVERTILRAN